MKKIGILAFWLLIIISIAQLFFQKKKEAAKVLDNVYPVSFSGKVELISNNRGFKIKLSNESKYFDLSGTCNDTVCLAQNITWGDSLFKKANSNIIILKANSGGKVSQSKLPAHP